MRLASEFIAGILVGIGLGWGLDRLAGTSPWGLIGFLLLGFVAGVFNVVRAPREMTAARRAAIAAPQLRSGRAGRARGDRGVEQTAATDKVDPIHQFGIHSLVDFGTIGGVHIAFTNSALFMFIAVALIAALLILGTSSRAVVPGRIQALAEISYEFVANMLRESAGKEGMRFFPFVFSIFMFVLFCNVIGLVPYFFTVTSHIVITAALAVTIILLVSSTASTGTA